MQGKIKSLRDEGFDSSDSDSDRAVGAKKGAPVKHTSDSDDSDADSLASGSDSESLASGHDSDQDSGSSNWSEASDSDAERSETDHHADEQAEREMRRRRWLKDDDELEGEASSESESEESEESSESEDGEGEDEAIDEEAEAAAAKPKQAPVTAESILLAHAEMSFADLMSKISAMAAESRGKRMPRERLDLMLLTLKTLLSAAEDPTSESCASWMSGVSDQELSRASLIASMYQAMISLEVDFWATSAVGISWQGWCSVSAKLQAMLTHLTENSMAHSLIALGSAENVKDRRFTNSCIAGYAYFLEEEFVSTLKSIDHHLTEKYVSALSHLPELISVLVSTLQYLTKEPEANSIKQHAVRVAIKVLYHFHHMSAPMLKALFDKVNALHGTQSGHGAKSVGNTDVSCGSVLSLVVQTCLADGTKLDVAHCLLLVAVLYANNGKLSDSLSILESDLYDSVASVSDPVVHIAYNRAIVSAGVAAFTQGDLQTCFQLLSEVSGSGRLRDLVGQGFMYTQGQQAFQYQGQGHGQQGQDRSTAGKAQESSTVSGQAGAGAGQAAGQVASHTTAPSHGTGSAGASGAAGQPVKVDRRRQIPLHMYMNCEVVDVCYSFSTIILELPFGHTARSASSFRGIEASKTLLARGPSMLVGALCKEVDAECSSQLSPSSRAGHGQSSLVETEGGSGSGSAAASASKQSSQDAKRRLMRYRKFMETCDRLVFNWPHENTRDSIALMAKEIVQDNLDKALGIASGLRLWDSLPSGRTAVWPRIKELVLKSALKTYIRVNSASFSTFDISKLAVKFHMSASAAAETIKTSLANGEVHGKLETVGNHSLLLVQPEQVTVMKNQVLMIATRVMAYRKNSSQDKRSPTEPGAHATTVEGQDDASDSVSETEVPA